MQRHVKRAFVLTLAIIILVLGIIGIVMPVLPGVLFIAVALILLSLVSATVRAVLDRHTVRFPRVHKGMRRVERAVVRIVGDL